MVSPGVLGAFGGREVTLRAATTADIDLLYGIYRAAYSPLTSGEWNDIEQSKSFHAGFPLERARVIIAGSEVIGAIDAERRSDGWFLNNIEIRPDWQGRGIGSRLVGDLVARAHREGHRVALEVLKVNPARRLYERLGFVVIGETDTHYLMRSAPAG